MYSHPHLVLHYRVVQPLVARTLRLGGDGADHGSGVALGLSDALLVPLGALGKAAGRGVASRGTEVGVTLVVGQPQGVWQDTQGRLLFYPVSAERWQLPLLPPRPNSLGADDLNLLALLCLANSIYP